MTVRRYQLTVNNNEYEIDIEEISVTVENVHFKLPRALSA